MDQRLVRLLHRETGFGSSVVRFDLQFQRYEYDEKKLKKKRGGSPIYARQKGKQEERNDEKSTQKEARNKIVYNKI